MKEKDIIQKQVSFSNFENFLKIKKLQNNISKPGNFKVLKAMAVQRLEEKDGHLVLDLTKVCAKILAKLSIQNT